MIDPNTLSIPPEVSLVARTIRIAGFEAYLVGGCVRDILLKREPKDWDVTTNANPEQIQALFDETFYENDYGTVGVVTNSENPRTNVIEVTPYRIETGYSNARHPDEIRFSQSLSDDLKRRDFTINAIALNDETEQFIDEHGGKDDLARGTIVTVGDSNERFGEDALRMLRAVRIAAELNFMIDPKTAQGIATNAELMQKVSRERVRDELIRIIMSPSPLQALYIAQKMGILKFILPDVESAIGIDQNQAHSFDVYEHLLRSMQHAADKGWTLELRVAALLHDVGKPATRRWADEKRDWTFYNHEVVGAKMAKNILKDLRFPKEFIDTVTNLIRWHMFFSDPDSITLSAVRRIIANVGKDHIKELLNLRICDRIGTGRPKEQPFRLRKYMAMVDEAMMDPISVAMLRIDGKRILEISHEKPGPRLGWALHALLEEVLDDPTKNTAEYLEMRTLELLQMTDEELKVLGIDGKDRRQEEEEKAVKQLHTNHHV